MLAQGADELRVVHYEAAAARIRLASGSTVEASGEPSSSESVVPSSK